MSRRFVFWVVLVDLVMLVFDAVPLAIYPPTSPLVWLGAISALCALCALTLYLARPTDSLPRDHEGDESHSFTAPVAGRLTFEARAALLCLQIEVSDRYRTATMELAGPAEVIDAARCEFTDGGWNLAVPDPPASSSGVYAAVAGNTIHVYGTLARGVTVAGGQITVNGVPVSATPAPAPPTARVCLPAGSAVRTNVVAGSVTVVGVTEQITHESTSADLTAGTAVHTVTARTISGDLRIARAARAELRTISGDITIHAAYGPVRATTTSGDIAVHAIAAVPVAAQSVSGDITVTSQAAEPARVRARSISGRVRTGGRS